MHYNKGKNNVIADAFSLLDLIGDSQCLEGKNAPLEMPRELEQGCNIVQHAQMLECFLNLACLNDHGDNPLNYKYLTEQQVEDKKLQQLAKGKPDNYVTITLNGHNVLCYVKTYDNPETQWQIAFLRQLLSPTIQYFHTIIGNPGATRMRLTIQTRYYHPMLRKEIDDFACNACQKKKQSGPGYGLLPEQMLEYYHGLKLQLIS